MNKGIPILEYFHIQKQMPSLVKYKAYNVISEITNDSMIYPDLIWHANIFHLLVKGQIGLYMQNTSQGYFQGASSVTFLPLIDLKPTDESCIYSLLYFMEGQAKIEMLSLRALHSISHCGSKQ